MTRKKYISLCFIAFVTLFAGCKTSSSRIGTDSIEADIRLIAEGDGETFVFVTLENETGIGTFDLQIEDGDKIVVSANGMSYELDEYYDNDIPQFDYDLYYATWVNTDESLTEFTVSLFRLDHPNGRDSYVTMPGPGEIIIPQANDFYSGQNDLHIEWSDSDLATTFDVTLLTKCGTGQTAFESYLSIKDVPGDGFHTVSLQDIQANIPATVQNGALCSLRIEITGLKTGHTDSQLSHESTISAQKTLSQTVNLIIER